MKDLASMQNVYATRAMYNIAKVENIWLPRPYKLLTDNVHHPHPSRTQLCHSFCPFKISLQSQHLSTRTIKA
jgi:hypothetical protein